MMRLLRKTGSAFLGLSASLCAGPVAVTADFSKGADYPLSKNKFAVFNSGFITLDHYKRDIHLYDEVKPASLRVDLWWGGNRWRPEVVGGTSDSLAFNFHEMDEMARLLNEHGVDPYWAYCYVPVPLQSVGGDHRSTPTSYQAWGELLRAYASHTATGPADIRVRYHEIYNEPDNRDFFLGGLDAYLQLYDYGVRGLKAGDPDAVVGGPAIAFTDSWVEPFLEYVTKNDLPLDFFSFHFYPTVPYESDNVAGVISDMRTALSQYPELATTEMHLNEYNSFKIDYPEGGRQDRHEMAAAMLEDFHYFLTQPDLTMVHWAQFQDTGGGNWSGMISREGHRKASFNTYKLYQNMPIGRNKLEVRGSAAINGFASSGDVRAALLLWNRGTTTETLNVKLRNLPVVNGRTSVYRIDATHASWGDNAPEELKVVEEYPLEKNASTWAGKVPAGGILYLEASSASVPVELPPPLSSRVVRVLRHFPDRSSTAYADFDEGTWTFRMGTGSETSTTQRIGVVAEDVPNELEVTVEVQTDGLLSANPFKGVKLRLDYQVGSGYFSSVEFHDNLTSNSELFRNAFPWGTKAASDKAIIVDGLQDFSVPVSAHAPSDWSGRVIITAIIAKAEGTRARIAVSGGE